MPKIVEESAAVSSHCSDMNTTEFLSQYMVGRDRHQHLLSLPKDEIESFNRASPATADDHEMDKQMHSLRQYLKSKDSQENILERHRHLTSQKHHKSSITVYDACNGSSHLTTTVKQMGADLPVITTPVLTQFKNQDRSLLSACTNSTPACGTLTLVSRQSRVLSDTCNRTELPAKGQELVKANKEVEYEELDASAHPQRVKHENIKGTSLAHFVQKLPLPTIDPETNFITSLSSRRGGSLTNRGQQSHRQSNQQMVLNEDGSLATFRANQQQSVGATAHSYLFNQQRSSNKVLPQSSQFDRTPTLSGQPSNAELYLSSNPKEDTKASKEAERDPTAFKLPLQEYQRDTVASQKQSLSTDRSRPLPQSNLSKFLNHSERNAKLGQVTLGGAAPCETGADNNFNLSSSFQIDANSQASKYGGRQQLLQQQMRTLDESQLSQELQEELNSLRHCKEPGRLMIPNDTPDLEDLSSLNDYKDRKPIGRQNDAPKKHENPDRTQPQQENRRSVSTSSYPKSANSERNSIRQGRRATANFKKKPLIRQRDTSTSGQRVYDSAVTNVHEMFKQPRDDDVISQFPQNVSQLQHQASAGDLDSQNDEIEANNSTTENLVKNLFYLQDEMPMKKNYNNDFGQILHKSMNYKCVDGKGPNKRIQIDLVDIVEHAPQQQDTMISILSDLNSKHGQKSFCGASTSPSQNKHRSLIYFKVMTQADQEDKVTETKPDGSESLRELGESNDFTSYENMYNKVTEHLVARVLQNEQQRQDQVAQEFETVSQALPQAFLLIGENDTNLTSTPHCLNKPQIMSNSSRNNITKASTANNSSLLHERLYKDGQAKRQRQKQLESQVLSQRIKEQEKACTFKPMLRNLAVPMSAREKQSEPRASAQKHQRLFSHRASKRSGAQAHFLVEQAVNSTTISEREPKSTHAKAGAVRKLRSPEAFYQEMITFKERKENRLELLRSKQLQKDLEHCQQRYLSADARSQSSLRSIGGKNHTTSQQRLKKTEAEKEAFFLKLSRESLGKPARFVAKDENMMQRKASKEKLRSTRQVDVISNELYMDHFERETRRATRQAHECQKVKNVTINLKHSKEILASKIATSVDKAYTQATSMAAQSDSSISKDVMLGILKQLGYVTRSCDLAEMNLFAEAWSLLENQDWVTLGNLTTFLIAIEKLHLNHKPSREYSRCRQFGAMSSEGVFILSDEADANALYRHFVLFNKNKQLLNEQQRLEEILNQQDARKRSEATFTPAICIKSERLAKKNRSQVLSQQQWSTSREAAQKINSIEDMLLLQGDLTRRKLDKKRQNLSRHRSQQRSTRAFTSISPRCDMDSAAVNTSTLSNGRQKHAATQRDSSYSHFENLYKRNAEKHERLEKSREFIRKKREAVELREAIFKPNMAKTKKLRDQVASKHLDVHGQRKALEKNSEKEASNYVHTAGSQTYRQPNVNVSCLGDKENDSMAVNKQSHGSNAGLNTQKRNLLLQSFLTKAVKSPKGSQTYRKTSKQGRLIRKKQSVPENNSSTRQDLSLTDREIMDRLGYATGAINNNNDQCLLDTVSQSMRGDAPLNDQSYLGITPGPIGGELSPVLDKTIDAAALTCNHFIVEESGQQFELESIQQTSTMRLASNATDEKDAATIDFSQYSASLY